MDYDPQIFMSLFTIMSFQTQCCFVFPINKTEKISKTLFIVTMFVDLQKTQHEVVYMIQRLYSRSPEVTALKSLLTLMSF